jgi:hypothetical protein
MLYNLKYVVVTYFTTSHFPNISCHLEVLKFLNTLQAQIWRPPAFRIKKQEKKQILDKI